MSTTNTRTADFYPRPPRGGRRRLVDMAFTLGGFLSTPSARRATDEWPELEPTLLISIHALREEGDCVAQRTKPHDRISIHALREEGDRKPWRTSNPQKDFYPRPPRGGRPAREQPYRITIGISIHALREEGDQNSTSTTAFSKEFLSTPSARRATNVSPSVSPNLRYFYPRPPRGGRHAGEALRVGGVVISIHALREEGDPTKNCSKLSPRDFYPRPPRGGRQNAVSPTPAD